jgi:hypothetical protein
MARFRIALLPTVALLALALCASAASALVPPQRGPLFTAAPQGPFDVGKAPTDVMSAGPEPVAAVVDNFAHLNEGWDFPEIAVADHRTGQLQLFTKDGAKHLRLAGTVPLGPEPTAAVGHECCVPVIYATTAGNNRLMLLSDFEEGEFRERRSFPVGSRPSAALTGFSASARGRTRRGDSAAAT